MVLFIKMTYILNHNIPFVYYMLYGKVLKYESLSPLRRSSELGFLLTLSFQLAGFREILLRRQAYFKTKRINRTSTYSQSYP